MIAEDAWALIHAERERVLTLLEGLDAEQWATRSLCADWSVEQVAAHLSAAASTGRWAWIRSIVLAGFDADRHNARLLRKRLGAGPDQTLEMYRRAVPLTVAPTKDYAAFLGEVIVHGQDIARPLGVVLEPDAAGLIEVARFYATKDFAVRSRSLVAGLRLEAADASFVAGDGPAVRGPLIDLVMAMAGRPEALDRLEGDGVGELRRRMRPAGR